MKEAYRPEAHTRRARRASMAWMGRGLHTYNFEVRQVEKHTPRRRRPIPCRRFRNRRAKRVDYWRTPPHLTANVRLVSRTYASCHVRNGVVTFPPRDGERKYESRHVVSLRTPPRGGCTTEPSTCVAWRSLVWRAIDIRFYRIGNPTTKTVLIRFVKMDLIGISVRPNSADESVEEITILQLQ